MMMMSPIMMIPEWKYKVDEEDNAGDNRNHTKSHSGLGWANILVGCDGKSN